MGLFKNEVGRPSNETIKKRNIFKGLCILLVIVVICLVAYILNNKGVFDSKSTEKESNNKNGNVVKTTTKKNIEEKISDEEGEKIVKEVFGNFIAFHVIDSKKLELNDNMMKTYAAILNVKEGNKKYTCKELFGPDIEKFDSYGNGSWKVENLLCADGTQTLYSYSDVNKQYKKMFGENSDASKSVIIDTIYGGAYGYSEIENGYSFLSCECGGAFPPTISGFKNAKKSDNILTIDYAEIIEVSSDGYFTLNDGTKVKYDYTKAMDEEFLKYKDKIDVIYTLVFEEQVDGSYIFIKAK